MMIIIENLFLQKLDCSKGFSMPFNCRLIVFFKKYSLQTNNGSSSLCPKAKPEWRYIF